MSRLQTQARGAVVGAVRVCALAIILLAAFSATTPMRAQGSRKDDVVFNGQGKPMAGATVRVCTSAATGQPCSPLAQIYSDPGLTQALANPTTTDGLGNYTFYASPGRYEIEVSGPNITTKQLPNVILPSDPTSPTFTTVTSTSGISAFSLTLSGNLTVSGAAAVTGALTVGGAPVPSTGTQNVWTSSQLFKGPIPWIDATTYGVRGLANAPFNTITATTGTNSPTVTTTGISDFIANDGIVIPVAGAATAQSTPSAPTVTPIGATGAITLNYKCVGVDAHWGLTAASPAGSTSTAPTVFGNGAVGISSISRSSNTVTVNAASTLPFSSGTFHAVIANVTGGTTQFSGLQLVTVTSGTTLTYSQTGANESGTVSGSSYILFENAFIITTVQATAGSNQIVLTTDVNHNIQFSNSSTRPTKIFLDGINFSGATPPGYADGLFAVAAVTSNTITVTTSYTSPVTVTATASATFATSQVAQMTATVYPLIDVVCPAISGTTKYYAVYRGTTPIGFTPWLANIFEDYGPGFTENQFVPPPAMNLPATPPVSAQNQVYSGQITGIASTTLTVTPNVPTAVTSVTAYHDNGVPMQNAVAASCSNGSGSYNSYGFAPVYLPRQTPGGGFGYYLFSAPVDLSLNCNRVNVIDGGAIWANGTIYADGASDFTWTRPHDVAGGSIANIQGGMATTIVGNASPMMVPGVNNAHVEGMNFATNSNGQYGLVHIGTLATFNDDQFSTCGSSTNGNLCLTSIPFLLENTGFLIHVHDIQFSGDNHIMWPFADTGDTTLGQVIFWPVPAIEFLGPNIGYFILDGNNYGVSRGIQFDALYGNLSSLQDFSIHNVETFQGPFQPLFTSYGTGGGVIARLDMVHNVMDSVIMPVTACVALGRCVETYTADGSGAPSNYTSFSGFPSDSAFEFLTGSAAPAQNTNACHVQPLAAMTCNGLPVTGTLCSGTIALPTAAITSGSKSALTTATCTGLATTDNIQMDFNTDPSAVTGYNPSSNGTLTIVKFPTANTINLYLYNDTASSITPGSMTVNYRVVR